MSYLSEDDDEDIKGLHSQKCLTKLVNILTNHVFTIAQPNSWLKFNQLRLVNSLTSGWLNILTNRWFILFYPTCWVMMLG